MAETRTSEDTLATLHVVAHLDWEREGRATFDIQRAQLLDAVAALTAKFQETAQTDHDTPYTILGGQTIILDDISEVRPSLFALLAIYGSTGRTTRLGIGPWYVLVDVALVSGESLVRNLLFGRADCQQLGLNRLNVAYLPRASYHAVQLPQILRSFEIDAALLCVQRRALPLPFRWQAPDESDVLVVDYQRGVSAESALESQREAQPDGPFLWLTDKATPPDAAHLKVKPTHSTLDDYVASLRTAMPDNLRPALNGGGNLSAWGGDAGRFSARMPLKQAHTALQADLTYFTERLLSLAGETAPQAENWRGLLHYAWRLLLQNQSYAALGGLANDAVRGESDLRDRRLRDIQGHLVEQVLATLPGDYRATPTPAPDADETPVVVWNTHGFEAQQIVQARLHLPSGRYPALLLAPDDSELPFTWNADAAGGRISFLATVPAVSYATYRVKLSDQPTPHVHLKSGSTARVITNAAGDTVTIENGQLVWKYGDRVLTDFLRFLDGGDAGDVRSYQQPEPDLVVQAALTDTIMTESAPTCVEMTVRHRMRIAPRLVDGGRSRGLKVLDLASTFTFYENQPGLYVRTTLTNSAEDHRLRAHIRSGLQADMVAVDTAYALLKRRLMVQAAPQVMHTVCALGADSGGAFALFTRGLPEVEVVNEDGQSSLALTLLRAVGQLDETTPAPEAQMQGTYSVDYMLLPLDDLDPAEVLRQAALYSAPLRAYQYAEAPEPRQQQYLKLSDERVLLTALKPPHEDEGWIVRLLNPTDTPLKTTITPHRRIKSARQVSLAEVPQAEYERSLTNVTVDLAPHQVKTLHLTFE